MPTYGQYTRSKPRIVVTRGWPGNKPRSLSRDAPPKTGEDIKSGMVISLDGSGEWVKGCPKGSIPYFAVEDQEDTDVKSSGKLLGLSAQGSYEIESGYFDDQVTYNDGDPLKAMTGGDAGKLTKKTSYDTGTDDTDSVGNVSRGGLQDISETDSSSDATQVLSFVTYWDPAQSA